MTMIPSHGLRQLEKKVITVLPFNSSAKKWKRRLLCIETPAFTERFQSGGSSSSKVSSTATGEERVMATQHWFETTVIGEKLCPFAAPLLQQPELLRIVASNATNELEVLADVSKEVEDLLTDNNEVHETTLVVFGAHHPFVHTFRDFVRLSWTLQEQVIGDTYMDQLQLVLFHPQATHQTYVEEAQEDINPANYTIRSPYPTIHLLREVDVLKAVQGGYPNLESLPSRNKTKLVEQGLEVCQKRLEECYRVQAGTREF